jgi:hypothetical protein
MDKITRRLFLRNSAVAGAAAATVAGPVVAEASEPQNRYARFTIEDNHAVRLVRPGDMVIYDTVDREPVHGEIFVTLTDKRRRLYLCRARKVGKYWYAERFDDRDWYGPMTFGFFRARVQGRATGMCRSFEGGRRNG